MQARGLKHFYTNLMSLMRIQAWLVRFIVLLWLTSLRPLTLNWHPILKNKQGSIIQYGLC